jgi:hypothetical protein
MNGETIPIAPVQEGSRTERSSGGATGGGVSVLAPAADRPGGVVAVAYPGDQYDFGGAMNEHTATVYPVEQDPWS